MAEASNKGGQRHHHRSRSSSSLFLLRMSLLLSSPFFFFFQLRRVHQNSSSASTSALFAHAFNLHHLDDITLERCRQPYNSKALFDFYRTNFHDRRNKKHVPSLPNNSDDDAVYTLKSRQHDDIVAALRLTKSKNDEQYTFLRSMCVSREHRRRGLATRLLKESLQQFDAHRCYCFASPKLLDSFYQKSGFTSASESGTETITTCIPKWMINSFESMSNRNQHKELKLYIKQQHSSPSSAMSTYCTEIVLLQHCSEISKKTATGWLLNDTQYSNHLGRNIPINGLVESRMKLTIWPWGGTNDITMIEEQIMRLKDNNRTVYLLWTDSGATTVNEKKSSNAHDKSTAETYIIIDGTWQQAKKIFRKIPALWSLPRISFGGTNNVPLTTYVLRGDYSGWRERFSGSGDGRDLLCTAEVAAAVLDRCGECGCANVIRSRLDTFQSTFPQKTKDERVG